MTDSSIPLLVVVGGGPKAAALAAKARVLNDLKLGTIRIKVLEREKELAANWRGGTGYTTGSVPLCTPPEKDVGFPYASIYGTAVDRRMLADYSWHAHKIQLDKTSYADWVDRGREHPSHNEWANYIKDVLMPGPEAKSTVVSEAFPDHDVVSVHQNTKVELIEPAPDGKVMVRAKYRERDLQIIADGVVLTGPGNPKLIKDSEIHPGALVFDGRNYWTSIDRFEAMTAGTIGVIGGGETAASIVLSLLDLTKGKSVSIDIINRHGAIFTRGESYNESRRFSNPTDWTKLDPKSRDEFIRRTDRGVFSVGAQKRLSKARNIGYEIGQVTALKCEGNMVNLTLERAGDKVQVKYDAVIVALGFDPWSSLDLLPKKFKPFAPDDKGLRVLYEGLERNINEYFCPSFAHVPDMQGVRFNVHMPMVSALAQGPGFPSLCSLGHLSDRIISCYLPPPNF